MQPIERINEDVPAELAIVTTALRAWIEPMSISERIVMTNNETMTALRGTFHLGETCLAFSILMRMGVDD